MTAEICIIIDGQVRLAEIYYTIIHYCNEITNFLLFAGIR